MNILIKKISVFIFLLYNLLSSTYVKEWRIQNEQYFDASNYSSTCRESNSFPFHSNLYINYDYHLNNDLNSQRFWLDYRIQVQTRNHTSPTCLFLSKKRLLFFMLFFEWNIIREIRFFCVDTCFEQLLFFSIFTCDAIYKSTSCTCLEIIYKTQKFWTKIIHTLKYILSHFISDQT